MGRSLPLPYTPTSPPAQFDGWPRWIDEELNRIAQAVAQNPIILSMNGSGALLIDDVSNPVVLGIDDDPVIDFPGGAWDKALGEWTCPQSGAYLINATASISPFGSGNKTYSVSLELFVNGLSRIISSDGGADDVPLGVTDSGVTELFRGDSLVLELDAIHEQFSGSSNYTYGFSYMRVANL